MRQFLGILSLLLVISLLLPTIPVYASPDGVVIGTTNSSSGVGEYANFQRRAFQTADRFWAFYYNYGNLEYTSSTDGISWATNTTIKAIPDGRSFGIWYDGTYVHYVTSNPLVMSYYIYYRRGTPNADGSITWSAAEQQVQAYLDERMFKKVNVVTDSQGYPWIAYIIAANGSPRPWVIKASTNDGTWTTASGFPYNISPDPPGDYCIAIPLTDSKMYIYNPNQGRLYDGGWGSLETIPGSASYDWYGSGISIGDDVYVSYTEGGVFKFNKRTYGVGWGSEQTIATHPSGLGCVGSVLTKSIGGRIYSSWQYTEGGQGKIAYKRYLDGAWDDTETVWSVEPEEVKLLDAPGTFYEESSQKKIGAIFVTGGASPPFNVRFVSFEPPPPPTPPDPPPPGYYGMAQVLTFVWIGIVILSVVGLLSQGMPLVSVVMIGGIMAIFGSVGVQIIIRAIENLR